MPVALALAQVWRGAEDGRLMRMLTRLCFVLERPESSTDPAWAETGACADRPPPQPLLELMMSPCGPAVSSGIFGGHLERMAGPEPHVDVLACPHAACLGDGGRMSGFGEKLHWTQWNW